MRTFLLFLLVVCSAPFALQAQLSHVAAPIPPYESDILAARPIRNFLGIGLGGYGFRHDGSFSPNCDCDFGGETGGSVLFALEFTRHYPKLGFALRTMLTYYDVSAVFSYEEIRNSVQVGDNPDIMVRYSRASDVDLRMLAFTPVFALYPTRSGFFLQAGLELGIPVKALYDNNERILTPDVTYFDGSTEYTLLATDNIPGGKKVRLAIAGAAGYDIMLSPGILLTPQVGLNLPLTSVSSIDSDWRVTTMYGLLYLKLRL